MSDEKNPNHEMGGAPILEQSEPLDSLPVPSHLWGPVNAAFQAMCKQADLPKGYQKVSFDRGSGSFVIHERPEAEPEPKPALEPDLIPSKGKGKKKAAVAAVGVALCLLVSGCVTKYEDIHSDFHTVQNGQMCYTVANDERKFNAPTMAAPPQECLCSQLVSVKRLAKKANESPEAWACPAPVSKEVYNTSIVPAGQVAYAPSLASTYVPAIGQAAMGAAIGGGIAAQQAARMTQSIQPFSGSAISTLYVNGQVPNWLVKP